MIRPRGIFAKLVGVFLLVGLLPFLILAGLWYFQARTRMTEAVIESWLVRLARETAAHIDQALVAHRTAVLLWSEEQVLARMAGSPGSAERLRGALARRADQDVGEAHTYSIGRPFASLEVTFGL